MAAAQNGHEQVCSSQFEYVDSCIQLRCAHFHTFSSHHLEQVLRVMLMNGAAVDVARSNGFTALMTACEFGHDLCARALLEAGARKEIKNSSGSTALSIAKSKGHTAICKLLEP